MFMIPSYFPPSSFSSNFFSLGWWESLSCANVYNRWSLVSFFLLWHNFCTIKWTFNITVIGFAIWCEVGIMVTTIVNLLFQHCLLNNSLFSLWNIRFIIYEIITYSNMNLFVDLLLFSTVLTIVLLDNILFFGNSNPLS